VGQSKVGAWVKSASALTFSTGKTRITINLDDAVLQAYKARAGGRGYQTLINETLREAMRGVQLADLVCNVIREELLTL
jgi:uncharacterized protein (DUF4415 family)